MVLVHPRVLMRSTDFIHKPIILKSNHTCSQIVLGSIATKSQMGLARSALSHLESAYSLFTKVSDKARAGKILVRGLHDVKEDRHLSSFFSLF